MAQYSANLAPDLLAKVVYQSPSWGHYELFGVASFFRDRVFPNARATPPSSAGAYNDSTVGGGIGGSLRVPTLHKHLDVGLKGLWGDGTGRYGSSTIADLTVRPDGQLALLHNFSALGTLEFHVSPRLDVYANYGGDYVGRRYFMTSPTKAVGYGSYLNVETGCDTEPVPGTTITRLHARPSRPTAPRTPRTFRNSPLATGTTSTADLTGRLRQGLQYAYFQRNIWSGIGTTPNATDNMFWTSFRYYLP